MKLKLKHINKRLTQNILFAPLTGMLLGMLISIIIYMFF